MDVQQVTILIQSFRIRQLRAILFPEAADASSAQYLEYDLLKSLPTIMPAIEYDTERDGDRRDMTYTVIEFERCHRSAEDFTDVLHSAILSAAHASDPLLVEVMIHSGGNLFYPITSGPDESDEAVTLFDALSQLPDMQDVVNLYFPGVWNAVETGNIHDLRRLVNCWCSTDLYLNGESLLQLAHRMGHESVIRLIAGAHHTLRLIHAFLGGNVPAIKALLEEHPPHLGTGPLTGLSEYGINLDFKHLSDNGAPLLYYVIQRNEVEIARLLVGKGCKIYTMMRIPETIDGVEQLHDVPVFYSALTNPDLDPDMMSALLSYFQQEPDRMHDLLYRMMFRGKNCIETAIQHSLNLPAFEILVQRAGAKVIADRNESCQTARDVAIASDRQDYADIIDACVVEMLQQPDKQPHQRQILALFGYDLTDLVLQEPPVDSFISMYSDYQSQIKKLAQAIVNDDATTFAALSWWTREDGGTAAEASGGAESSVVQRQSLFERLLVWDGREGEKNPLPLLHRAVIHERLSIVHLILEVKPAGQSIDCLFDNYRRTALHYAEARKEWQEARDLLREYGSSDHALDRVSDFFLSPSTFLFFCLASHQNSDDTLPPFPRSHCVASSLLLRESLVPAIGTAVSAITFSLSLSLPLPSGLTHSLTLFAVSSFLLVMPDVHLNAEGSRAAGLQVGAEEEVHWSPD